MAFPQEIPLLEIARVLHHPNFYWGGMGGFTNCKYLTITVDTRDLKCYIKDRDGKLVDWEAVKAALDKPIMAEMNANPQIEIREIVPGPEA